MGSSAMRMEGLLTSALAMATRCFCPPESSLGLWCILSSRPTRLSASVASDFLDSFKFVAYMRGSSTFLSAVALASSSKDWKTKPIL